MSSVASVPLVTYAWSVDALAFAARQKVASYLEPLLAVTCKLFPTGQVKVFFEQDVELSDEQYIVFEVHVPQADAPDYLAADHKWRQEILHVLPGPLHEPFVFSLRVA